MKDASLDDMVPGLGADVASWAETAEAPIRSAQRAWPLTAPSQQTLAGPVRMAGVGLHSGAAVTLTISSAPADSGLWVRRTDVTDVDPMIPARWDHVVDTRLCTVLGNASGVTVSTVEHLMAALAGLGIDNAEICVDGPELPIMDGSSAAFVEALTAAGVVAQGAPRSRLRVLETVTVRDGDSEATLRPAPRGLSIDAAIDFESAAIGRQRFSSVVTPAVFRVHMARARTFGFRHEVEGLRAMGLARGGSLDNAVVVDGDTVMNPEGLRHEDEFARHKALDALGDLALAGHAIIGAYAGVRPSHRLNNLLLRALFDRPQAWRFDPPLPAGKGTADDCAENGRSARRQA
jgi:UDP-3-O-[3-hydroxymyristoyl] N-acetylglucosamine deacetylase